MKKLSKVVLGCLLMSVTAFANSNGSEWDNIQKPGSIDELKSEIKNDIHGRERYKRGEAIMASLENPNIFYRSETFLDSIADNLRYTGFSPEILVPVAPGLQLGAVLGFKIIHPRDLSEDQRNASFMDKGVSTILNYEADKTLCNDPVMESNFKFCHPKILSSWNSASHFAKQNGGLWVNRTTGFKLGVGTGIKDEDILSIPVAATGVNILVGGGFVSDLYVETEMFYKSYKDLITQGVYFNLPSTPEKALKFEKGSVVRFHKKGDLKIQVGASYGVNENSLVHASLGALVGLEINGVVTTEFKSKGDGFIELSTKLFDKQNYSAMLYFESGVKIPLGEALLQPYGLGSVEIDQKFKIIKLAIEKIIESEVLETYEIDLKNKDTHKAYVAAISGDMTKLKKLSELKIGAKLKQDMSSKSSFVRGTFSILGLGLSSESGVKVVKDSFNSKTSKIFFDNYTTNVFRNKKISVEGVLEKDEDLELKVGLNFSVEINKKPSVYELSDYIDLMFATDKKSYVNFLNASESLLENFSKVVKVTNNGNYNPLYSNGPLASLNLKYNFHLSEEDILSVKNVLSYTAVKGALQNISTTITGESLEYEARGVLTKLNAILSQTENKAKFAQNLRSALSGKHVYSESTAKVLYYLAKPYSKRIEFAIQDSNEKM